MIFRMASSILLPFGLFILCGFVSENVGAGLVSVAAHGTATFMLTWPLDLLATLGSSSDEGFYGRWLSVSAVVSLAVFSVLTFFGLSLIGRRRAA
jgi:hypothetical protein